jgi:hypothetical protein
MTTLAAILACPRPLGAAGESPLPACPPEHAKAWDTCIGLSRFPNGDRYEGTFRDDLPNGQGTYKFSAGVVYTGDFRDGAFNGNGVLTFSNGSKYVGQFRDGAYDGIGIEYLPNGRKGRAGVWFNSQFIRQSDQPGQAAVQRREVHLVKDAGTFMVPVAINDSVTLHFTVDSGATDVSVPDAVVAQLRRDGSLRDADFLGPRRYVLADGSKVTSETFLIRSMRVGDWVVDDVLASAGGARASLLLGQSFLGRFHSWSIDNTREVLVLE